MENDYKLYMHTSPSGKHYIGITSQRPQRRWRTNGEGYNDSPVFYNAIKKYGWDNFRHDILLDGLSYEQAEKSEKELIAIFKSTDRNYGYNMESGGVSGKHLSEETKRKLSEINKGNNNFAQWRANGGKTVAWNKGTKGLTHHTDEWKQMMSERMSGANSPCYGKPLSEEAKRKISKANTGKNLGTLHWNARAINQYTLEGVYLKTFDTVTQVANYLGKDKASDISNVTACANGRRNKAYGYIWKYV